MSNENEQRLNQKQHERREHVALTPGSVQKVNRWLEQADGKRVRLSRKDLLNWFIEKSPENLSNADLNSIVERYYDEEAFLRQLLRETRQAKKDGQAGQLEIIVRSRRAEARRENTSTVTETSNNE